MLQLVPSDSDGAAEYYDRCLDAVRCILMDDRDEAVNYRAVTRIGKYVLFPIHDCYHVCGSSDSDDDEFEETSMILKARMQYFTAYLIETHDTGVQFSLYPVTPNLEAYYLKQGILMMRIGSYDWATFDKYHAMISKINTMGKTPSKEDFNEK